MIRKYTLLFLVMISPVSLAQVSIYKWTDSNGDVHFSDKPHVGAEELPLPKVQTYSAPKIAPPEGMDTDTTEQADAYSKFTIIQPADQITIRNPQGYVSVILDIKPQLKKGDKLQLIVDGNSVGSPQENTIFAVTGLNRGSHTVSAQILNNEGKTIKTTNTIAIFMQQPRVGMGKGSP